ncbi:MAG: histidine kinase [Saprospiraceae bacterium]|nr:histidine kinase [Candidatus Opimibacter skivensis]
MDRRLSTLELQALRSRLNPHFIFNCLNSINRYILKEEKGKASYYLSQFAKLIRYTLDYTSEPDVSLSEEINVSRLYVELESLRMPEPIQLEVHL